MTVNDSEAWLEALDRDGYCVVPNVIPIQACKEYQDSAMTWLEGFGKGFKRDDPSTWSAEHLPRHFAGGMYSCHGVMHSAWVWKIRTQPGIQEVFKKVWGESDLVASFDACNISLPLGPQARKDIEPTKPWPHIDQSPELVHKRQEVQGIANLYPSGPNDGGLVVVKGSSKLHRQYFDEHGRFPFDANVDPKNVKERGMHFDYKELDWYLAHGAEIIKVCANEGDFILWDSRTIHWNRSPQGDQTRFATYVAYAPRKWMTEAELETKLEVFRKRIGTGHVATRNPDEKHNKDRDRWDLEDGAKSVPARPREEPEESPEIMWAVGVRP
ncbi:hypothetical protein BD324DRAFT_632596 [Kockovaella imperatae]|uniref:Phytanoyl-CoA dioxygenase n=1 Tax=Kockovaella imperatae TaxID=4999 RepID=A0A1Y1UBG7_9TREE|nr:hypothetical protein BD324DRAFT_632596 [Kockovaella imperatae]ORX35381.1 hypothetical protein BD324DRAFT_632596 [Kockovaella imperatae]